SRPVLDVSPGAPTARRWWVEPWLDSGVAYQPVGGNMVAELVFSLRDRKGGDPDEWPKHLRVRELPLADSTV
ncbi:MAG: hypothetical protein K2Q20_06030, partial [Phycisphaerales bacterium]|nr:hypothetical protein [Phycisphaerales bacterium]